MYLVGGGRLCRLCHELARGRAELEHGLPGSAPQVGGGHPAGQDLGRRHPRLQRTRPTLQSGRRPIVSTFYLDLPVNLILQNDTGGRKPELGLLELSFSTTVCPILLWQMVQGVSSDRGPGLG